MTTTTTNTPTTGVVETNRLAGDRVARGGALVVRVVAALLWMDNLSWKKPPNFGEHDHSGLWFFTHQAVAHPVFAPYTSLVKHVILPNFQVFGWAAYLTEIALASFLLLGLATRFWAVVGIGQSLVIYLSVGHSPNEWKWSYFLMMAVHLAIFAMAAGRVFGLDALVRLRAVASPGSRWARWALRAT